MGAKRGKKCYYFNENWKWKDCREVETKDFRCLSNGNRKSLENAVNLLSTHFSVEPLTSLISSGTCGQEIPENDPCRFLPGISKGTLQVK